MRIIFSFITITTITITSFFILSCGKNSKDATTHKDQNNREEQSANTHNTDDEIAIENLTIRQCGFAYSADIVFISDPIFALHFVTDNTAKYDEFYVMAMRKNVEARMFVTAEETASALFQSSVEELPEVVKRNFKPLSKLQISTTLRSHTLVFSPLMRLFAPAHIQYIERYRKKCKLPPARTLRNGSSQNRENTIIVRYTKAIQKLASTIAAYMKEKNIQNMVAILDKSHVQNTTHMNILITALRDFVPNFQSNVLWHTRTSDTENITFAQLDVVAENEVVLLYAGMYTTRASHYLKDQENVDLERIFAIADWEYIPYKTAQNISYGIYASAWVAIPLSGIFENKNYINAKLYRLL